jgi:glycosyltransferase involved in cell wall biosynthesis
MLTTSYPHPRDDAAGTFVRGMARALAARGHEVEVLAPEPVERVAASAEPRVRVHHVPYLRPRSLQRTFYGAGVPDNLRLDPRAWLGLPSFPAALFGAAFRRAASWHALVTHWAVPCAAVAAAVARGRPHLAVFHSADVHLLERLPARHRLASAIAEGATTLLFVTEDLRQRFLRLVASPLAERAHARSVVQPMGIEPWPEDRNVGAAAGPKEAQHPCTVLFLGRLVPIKGVDVAVRAVGQLPGATLVVAGDGPERERLEALARRLGAPVRFVGFVEGERKQRLLREANVFVSPSRPVHGRTEGAPPAVLEAMDAGLAVVASRSGGLGELIDHGGTGLLVKPGDPGALGRALAQVCGEPALRQRLGAAARQWAARHHWSSVMARLEPHLRAPAPQLRTMRVPRGGWN